MSVNRVRMSLETRQRVVDMNENQGMTEKQIHETLVAEGMSIRLVAIKELVAKYREFGYITNRPRTNYGPEIMETIKEVIEQFKDEWLPAKDLRDIVRDITDLDIPTETIGRLRRKLGYKETRVLVFLNELSPEEQELQELEQQLKAKLKKHQQQQKQAKTATSSHSRPLPCSSSHGQKAMIHSTVVKNTDTVVPEHKPVNLEIKCKQNVKPLDISFTMKTEVKDETKPEQCVVTQDLEEPMQPAPLLSTRSIQTKQATINSYFTAVPRKPAQNTMGDINHRVNKPVINAWDYMNQRRKDIVNERKLRVKHPKLKSVA